MDCATTGLPEKLLGCVSPYVIIENITAGLILENFKEKLAVLFDLDTKYRHCIVITPVKHGKFVLLIITKTKNLFTTKTVSLTTIKTGSVLTDTGEHAQTIASMSPALMH